MRAQVKRSEWVAKSRECGAFLWEKDDDGFLFFGFFVQADGRRRTQKKKRETKQKQKDTPNTKKKGNKTKQTDDRNISSLLYLSTHT